ncbi:substrate-binding domain-containing protein [Burkholderia lata]|uniref:Ribose ABC transporter periplasmic ribose-binding protein n=1 Tax=Burkholderia lata (strain ATCC 17760 / DSM 23089 / LMG 22485 / NCIMB 9086 / R18194 / 383) TaxID=482957 RepID=A0A6P2ILF4_BURL3|nr:substrate-binding domain-containing protein [Burkholderia lata]VWB30729.1 ribose ABC transporter periplasmic ribose-binding protein [Burkholderia lata]
MRLPNNRYAGAALLAASMLLGEAGAADAAPPKTIALVQINQQALFFTQMNAGAQAAAKAAGVNLVIFNSNNDPMAQNNAIETYIQQKVGAILVAAIDVNGIKPAITEAKKAGIPVVTIDAIVNGDNAVQVGVDNRQVGADLGKYTAAYINKSMGGKARIGALAALNSYVQNVRLDGFKAGIAGTPGAKLVSVVDGQNVQDQAQTVGENLISGNPDLQMIYATGEPALIGAIAAVSAQDAGQRIKVIGWDLSAQAVKGIDQGGVLAVVEQDPAGEGHAAVDAAVRLMAGKAVEKQISVPATIVTKANVDTYRARFK